MPQEQKKRLGEYEHEKDPDMTEWKLDLGIEMDVDRNEAKVLNRGGPPADLETRAAQAKKHRKVADYWEPILAIVLDAGRNEAEITNQGGPLAALAT